MAEQEWPRLTAEEEELESKALSIEERRRAFADLYGRTAPCKEMTNVEAFEREMSHLPVKQKSAMHKGYTIKQARLFLGIENNDAKRAAKRMARYWERRFELLGDDAFRHMPNRTREDFRRVHEMALRVPTDPDADEETRRWAERFVQEWNRGHLLCLDQELEAIPLHERAALMEAQEQRPDMAASEEHKMLFLRSVNFDAEQAARRMAKYWNVKFELFGREGAFRSVTVNDLMRDHPRELSVGFFRIIPGTDNSGRNLIHFVCGRMFTSLLAGQGCTEEGLLRVTWYVLHALLEENSCRENGIVLLVDARYDQLNLFKRDFASRFSSLWIDTIPVDIKAIHGFVWPSLWFVRIFFPFIKWLLGKRIRMRCWIHTRTKEDSLSELGQCGISRDLVPITMGGNMDVDRVEKAWYEKRRDAGK